MPALLTLPLAGAARLNAFCCPARAPPVTARGGPSLGSDPLLATIASKIASSQLGAATSSSRRKALAGQQLGVDAKRWLIAFRDLDFKRQIGEGSFGRVGGWALLLACCLRNLRPVRYVLPQAAATARSASQKFPSVSLPARH